MKFFSLYILLTFSGIAWSQDKITEVDLMDYVDKHVRYCDKVYGTYVIKGKTNIALLNMGADYPDQKIVVAIFEENWNKFEAQPDELFNGKQICVSGKVVLYRDNPQIIVKNSKQIVLQQ